jgi:hypothetical protein
MSGGDCGAGGPPAAAQGDVEGGGILEAEGLGLDHADSGLLVLVGRSEDLEVVDQAGLLVGLDELQGLGGGVEGLGLSLEGFGVIFQRPEAVGHLEIESPCFTRRIRFLDFC